MKKDQPKNKKNRVGVVYSSDPDFEYVYESPATEAKVLAVSQQKLRISLDRKGRKGKEVTLISGFVGPLDALKALAKQLKSHCGVGGSAKDGQILLQGDHRDGVLNFLNEKGYSQTKMSGGR